LERKVASGIMLTLLLISMSTLAFKIEPVSAVTSPYIAVDPDSIVDVSLEVGDTFTVDIITDYDGSDVWGWEFSLTYDPSILHGVAVANGDLIVGGSATFISGTFDNTAGKLSLTGAFFFFIVPPIPTTSGPGTLATVTFEVVGKGSSDITLGDDTRLRGFTNPNNPDTIYDIIDAVLNPDQIGHGYFSNGEVVPIGQAEQVRPYESNPTVATLTNITATFGAERDGNLSTNVSFQGIPASASGVLYISGFTVPAPAQQFPIGWVDIKIKYRHPGVGDDGYLIGYKTSGAAYAWLQTTLAGPNAKFDMNGNPAVRPWSNLARTGGGAWTWTDVQNLTIRIIVTRGANAVWDSFLDLYEVWVTVYEHDPPSSSTAMSVMPGASNISIVGIPPGKYFFVDVYVNGLSGSPGLFGYHATIKYDESVVTALEYFSYWPFITVAPSAITPGVVSICYYTFMPDPVGFTGTSTPLCRIYFVVDAGGSTPLDLIDQRPTYVTELADVLGGSFVPPLYDGWFGNVSVYDLTIFVDGSGTTVPAVGVHTYDEGEVVSVTATADPGWIFDHWELNGDNVGSTNPINVIMTTNLTLHAVFSWVGTYDLTITTTTGGTTDPTPGIHAYTPGAVAVVSAIPDTNYWFDHWELDGNYFGSANPISVTMNTDHTLHAVFVDTPPHPVPEYPGADVSIVAATFGFLAALYLTLKRKKQNHTTKGERKRTCYIRRNS